MYISMPKLNYIKNWMKSDSKMDRKHFRLSDCIKLLSSATQLLDFPGKSNSHAVEITPNVNLVPINIWLHLPDFRN